VFAGQERFVPRSKSGKSGGYKITPGQLRDSIYRVHSDDDSNDGLQVYEVSWNHYKAPHGYWMEFGNARHPAHPFIRPAYEAAKQRAVQAGISRMAVKFAEARQVQ
jgi:HK97 gp10 family phage protein